MENIASSTCEHDRFPWRVRFLFSGEENLPGERNGQWRYIHSYWMDWTWSGKASVCWLERSGGDEPYFWRQHDCSVDHLFMLGSNIVMGKYRAHIQRKDHLSITGHHHCVMFERFSRLICIYNRELRTETCSIFIMILDRFDTIMDRMNPIHIEYNALHCRSILLDHCRRIGLFRQPIEPRCDVKNMTVNRKKRHSGHDKHDKIRFKGCPFVVRCTADRIPRITHVQLQHMYTFSLLVSRIYTHIVMRSTRMQIHSWLPRTWHLYIYMYNSYHFHTSRAPQKSRAIIIIIIVVLWLPWIDRHDKSWTVYRQNLRSGKHIAVDQRLSPIGKTHVYARRNPRAFDESSATQREEGPRQVTASRSRKYRSWQPGATHVRAMDDTSLHRHAMEAKAPASPMHHDYEWRDDHHRTRYTLEQVLWSRWGATIHADQIRWIESVLERGFQREEWLTEGKWTWRVSGRRFQRTHVYFDIGCPIERIYSWFIFTCVRHDADERRVMRRRMKTDDKRHQGMKRNDGKREADGWWRHG